MKRLSIIVFFISTFHYSYGRLNGCDTCKYLSLLVATDEIVRGYETLYFNYKASKKFSLEMGAGHIYPIFYSLHWSDVPTWIAYNGSIFRFDVKYFFHDMGPYVGFMATYKNLYYSWKSFSNKCGTKGDQGMYTLTKSENISQMGIAVVCGLMKRTSYNFSFDLFAGVGVNIEKNDYTNNSIDKDYHCALSNTDLPPVGHFTNNQTVPAILVGIKLGYTLYEKK